MPRHTSRPSSTQGTRTLSYAYDAASNRTSLTWPDAGSNALTVSYLYDPLGNVTKVEENGATSGPGLLATYSYDALGRRIGVSRAGGSGLSTTYAYSSVGLLSSLTQNLAGGAATTLSFSSYNAANQILSRGDSNGAYTARPASIASAYTTNGLNQYTAATGVEQTYSGATSAALSYDVLGRLQSETANGATTYFLYDGLSLIGEYGVNGTILNRYVPGPGVGEPLTWYAGSGTSSRVWYAADQQGSIIQTADQSANPGATTYTYGPYGEPITSAGAPAWGGSRYRYTGQIEIPGAQLYYYEARVYDPVLGRFNQTDPVGILDDVNLYLYVASDPLNKSDPTGLVQFIDPTSCTVTATYVPPDPGSLSGFGIAPSCIGGGGEGFFTNGSQVFDPGSGFAPNGSAASPQSNTPKISCSTRLPNGQTVGQVVQKALARISHKG